VRLADPFWGLTARQPTRRHKSPNRPPLLTNIARGRTAGRRICDNANLNTGVSVGRRLLIRAGSTDAVNAGGAVVSMPHMRHFYATVLPRLAKTPTLAVSDLEARDAAHISFADRFRDAGRVGGRRHHWGLGGAAFTVLICGAKLFKTLVRFEDGNSACVATINKQNFGLRQSARQRNRNNGKSQCELFIALWDREKVAFARWRKIAAVRLTKNPVQWPLAVTRPQLHS
jgi:hypothetical protein